MLNEKMTMLNEIWLKIHIKYPVNNNDDVKQNVKYFIHHCWCDDWDKVSDKVSDKAAGLSSVSESLSSSDLTAQPATSNYTQHLNTFYFISIIF